MKISEILKEIQKENQNNKGIKYSDIDFINQKLTIRRQLGRDIKKDDSELDAKTLTKQEVRTKTPSSVRTIDIPDIV